MPSEPASHQLYLILSAQFSCGLLGPKASGTIDCTRSLVEDSDLTEACRNGSVEDRGESLGFPRGVPGKATPVHPTRLCGSGPISLAVTEADIWLMTLE
jgi:hypothetical protein